MGEPMETITGAIYGPTKIGKSWLGGNVVKELDGTVLDFARSTRIGTPPNTKNAPTPIYSLETEGIKNVGDAYQAVVKTVGVDFNTQYKYVRTWEEFLSSVDMIKFYRDNISKKQNKHIWVVIDDVTNWRSQALAWVLERTGHSSPSQADWTMLGSALNAALDRLEENFNVLFVCQSKAEYIDDKETGNLVPDFYPKNLEFSVAFTVNYTVEVDPKTNEAIAPIAKIDSLRNKWRFGKKSYTKEIKFDDLDNIKFTEILKAMNFDDNLW